MTPIAPRYGGNVKLSKSHNILKCMASIVQVIYACFTLYRTRYDQIDRYGYAAYGLTVIPYAIMSLLNLAANIVTLDYPCLYMVRSEVMDEAERRGAKFEGTVGVIEPGPESDEHPTFHFETDAEVDGTNVSVHFTDPSSPGEDDVRFVRRDEEDPRIFVPRQGRYGSGEKCTWIYIREMLGRSLKIVALIALHLIINGLTKFDDGDSTAIQRGWTMAWLLFGQAYSLVGIFIENPMYIFLGSSYDLRKDPEEDWKLKQVVGYISFRILYGAPAVGGMVTVMQMMKQYGSCTVL